MNKVWLAPFLVLGISVGVIAEDTPVLWKDYDNPFLGIHLKVRREWTEGMVKEMKDTGTLSFSVTNTDPRGQIVITRQKIDQPMEKWLSTDVLDQFYQPGYKKLGAIEFAGRKSIKVVGKSKQDELGRREETYFSSNPPFVDQITFAATDDQWPVSQPDFAVVRRSIRWTK